MKILGLAILLGWLAMGCSSKEPTQADLDMERWKAEYARPGQIPFPAENPWSKAKEDLGQILFFDPRLSESQVTSCATCHNPSFGWQDGLAKAKGFRHRVLGRKTQTILNVGFSPLLFWDGRAASLEEQALGPNILRGKQQMLVDKAIERIQKIKAYEPHFEKAFPGEGISKETITKALATYQRNVVSPEGPFDYFVTGEWSALNDQQQRGFRLFEGKGKCVSCHSGWAFSDYKFHDIGIRDSDLGRGKHERGKENNHKFKTPTLRDVARRAPYFHNGQAKTLEDVVDFYNRGGQVKRKTVAANVTALNLSDEEKDDLVAFLKALNSPQPTMPMPELPQD